MRKYSFRFLRVERQFNAPQLCEAVENTLDDAFQALLPRCEFPLPAVLDMLDGDVARMAALTLRARERDLAVSYVLTDVRTDKSEIVHDIFSAEMMRKEPHWVLSAVQVTAWYDNGEDDVFEMFRNWNTDHIDMCAAIYRGGDEYLFAVGDEDAFVRDMCGRVAIRIVEEGV